MTVQINNQIDLQNPLPLSLPTLPPALVDRPQIVEHEPLSDAMDKLVNHPDESFSGREFWSKETDFADQIISGVNVETEAKRKHHHYKQKNVQWCSQNWILLRPSQ